MIVKATLNSFVYHYRPGQNAELKGFYKMIDYDY